jgi:hypothetical protein
MSASDEKPRVVIIDPKPVDPRQKAIRIATKAEAFFARGALVAEESAPEVKARWDGARALAGCLRAELQKPGSGFQELAKTLRGRGER